jgi:hypothetical protein
MSYSVRIASTALAILLATVLLSSSSGFAQSYSVISQFHGGRSGYYPTSTLLFDNGNLYGTTYAGGINSDCRNQDYVQGCGTVFQLARVANGSWVETVLYRFRGGSDGAFPDAPLIADNHGNLYGTTSAGGNPSCEDGCGTVFELLRPSTPSGVWRELVLYRFTGVPSGQGRGDAADPNGIVFGAQGIIFGTAYGGGYCVTNEQGTFCYGAVYELTPPTQTSIWHESILYRFTGPNGAPSGPILDKAGNLYSTAIWGKFGYGFIFKLAPPSKVGDGWKESAIFNFNCSDGAFPEPGLTLDNSGNIYGSTIGSPACNSGTVFKLSPQSGGGWKETTVYVFENEDSRASGSLPNGNLIVESSGIIYGTTYQGGGRGYGTVFALVPVSARMWTEMLLHNFGIGSGGSVPEVGLTSGPSGILFGTTGVGGSMGSGGCIIYGESDGCGVVFQIEL